jgi:site-specific DNA-methyltransferase (adenine-specific)
LTPYYEHGGISIFHGDCRQIVPMLARFDLLLTDPPYGIGIAANPVRQAHKKLDWDASPPEAYVLGMCMAHAEKVIIWGGNYFDLPPAQCFLVDRIPCRPQPGSRW